jgi:predicted site-specific integrase-resolvase
VGQYLDATKRAQLKAFLLQLDNDVSGNAQLAPDPLQRHGFQAVQTPAEDAVQPANGLPQAGIPTDANASDG